MASASPAFPGIDPVDASASIELSSLPSRFEKAEPCYFPKFGRRHEIPLLGD